MIERLSIKWVLVLALLVHVPMLRNGFTYYSDDTYVLNNILIHNINGDTFKTIFSTFFDGHYHPLTLLSLGITYFFSGDNAFGYQLTNLIFHLLNCYLLYLVLRKIKFQEIVSLIAVSVFAVHPLNVESVARITERKDTQYVLFLLLAVFYFIEFYENPAKRKFYYISLGCFLLSLLSKGQAVIFPLMIYAISWYRFKTSDVKIQHVYILPLFVISAFFAFLNYRAQIVTGYISETETIGITQIITYPAYIISHYIFKLFLPFNLSAQYPVPELNPMMWAFTLVFAVLIFLIYKLYQRKNYLAVLGILIYVIAVFPMLRIVPISENFMPDRYNYLGLAGFGIFVGSFYDPGFFKKYKLSLVIGCWLILLSVLCYGRTMVWKNGLTVWENAYKHYPDDKYAAISYAGNLTSSKESIGKGLSLYKSVAASDNNKNIINKIYYADVLSSLGRKEEKLSIINQILNAKPFIADDIANRASILLQYGRSAEAIAEFDKAVNLKPQFAKSRIKRAGCYMNQFMFDKALSELDTLEDLHSNFVDLIYLMRTEVYINMNNAAKAQKSLAQAKKIGCDPKKVDELQTLISNLHLVSETGQASMSKEQKIEYIKTLYSNGLYYHSYKALSDLLSKDPSNEQLLNYSLACAFKLNRPDLMSIYLKEAKKNNYPLNDNAAAYLAGLGIKI